MSCEGHDYPSSACLRRIERWSYKDAHGLLAFIKARWHWGYGWKERTTPKGDVVGPGRRYWMSTGGWSGNESIIKALMRNDWRKGRGAFWPTCWESSRVGGHYTFVVPDKKTERKRTMP